MECANESNGYVRLASCSLGGCIWRDRAGKDGTKERYQILMTLESLQFNSCNWMIFGRRISYWVFFKVHIRIFKYFLLLRKYCQLTRPMSAGEKIEPNFRFNDHVLNFCKYRQTYKWQGSFYGIGYSKSFYEILKLQNFESLCISLWNNIPRTRLGPK